MKRYSMRYESDEVFLGSHDQEYGMASSIKTCKRYISNCRKNKAEHHPRNFRIYDHYADVDPKTNYVPCIYREE